MFELFGKIKEYNIDGREINIVDKSNVSKQTRDIIKKIILTLCKKEKIATRFNKIIFYISDKKNEELDNSEFKDNDCVAVMLDRLMEGINFVYINAEAFDKYLLKNGKSSVIKFFYALILYSTNIVLIILFQRFLFYF